MSGTEVLLLVIGFVALVAAVSALTAVLQKRGIDPQKYLDKVKDGMETVNMATDLVMPFLPEKSEKVEQYKMILDAANIGVNNAEQLLKIGKIEDKDKRKEEAQKYIMDAMSFIGVDITPKVERLIEGATQAAVNALGHKATDNPTDETPESATTI